jgi:uncharacterized protein (TIRG00374 family)
MKVSLIIPARNEEDNIIPLLVDLVSVLENYSETQDYEICVVDASSTDTTPQLVDEVSAKNPRIFSIHQTAQPGFGNAIKSGLSACTGDVIIPVMGDRSDDPEDILSMVKKIQEGYDVVYGSRFIERGSLSGYPFQKMIANRSLNNLARILFGIPHTDVTNAFKAYRREVIDSIGVENLESAGFDLTLELPVRAYIEGFRSTEIPVHWYNREAGQGSLRLSRNASVYGMRLLKLFFQGILISFQDLFKLVFKGSKIGILVGFLLGIILLAAMFGIIGFSETIALMRRISLVWFAFSCLSIISTFILRTFRWEVILRSSGFPQGRGILFECILFGWLLNYLLPLRIGDIARAVALKTTRKAPFGMTLSTIIVERVYDLLALAVLLFVFASLVATSYDFTLIIILAVILSLLLVSALILIYRYDHTIVRFFGMRIPSLQDSLATLKDGLKSMMRDKPAIALCCILSFPIWFMEILSIYFAAYAIRQPIPYSFATISGITAFIAQSLPLTPAGIGVHEASITAILIVFNIAPQIGLSIALVDHAARALVIYLFGIAATVHIGFASRGYFRELGNNRD